MHYVRSSVCFVFCDKTKHLDVKPDTILDHFRLETGLQYHFQKERERAKRDNACVVEWWQTRPLLKEEVDSMFDGVKSSLYHSSKAAMTQAQRAKDYLRGYKEIFAFFCASFGNQKS